LTTHSPIADTPAATLDEAERAAVRVLLVDDHAVFRAGLRELLDLHGLDVVGEADDGDAALELVQETAPDVVVMDLDMPGVSGVEATRRISAAAPATRVIVLSASDEDNDVMEAILAGASGYLLKRVPVEELVAGISRAADGESTVSPAIAGKVLRRLRESTPAPSGASGLTDRELQVLRLIADGKDNSQIAAQLHISPKTVKNHISNILMKLQIENRIQAAVYAVRSGIA
jgi:two-component system NarL family response regulator